MFPIGLAPSWWFFGGGFFCASLMEEVYNWGWALRLKALPLSTPPPDLVFQFDYVTSQLSASTAMPLTCHKACLTRMDSYPSGNIS